MHISVLLNYSVKGVIVVLAWACVLSDVEPSKKDTHYKVNSGNRLLKTNGTFIVVEKGM